MFNIRKRRMAAAAAAITASAALVLTGCAGGGSSEEAAATYDPDEKVTLNLAFWGNDVRAALYDEAIAAFNEEYPNITVNSSFLGFPEFWEKRQTEAAGGGLPDVMQFDYSYLRQYSENGLLLDLEPYLGNIIDTEPLSENILAIGVVGGETTGIPTSTNAWGLFTNPKLLDQVGVEEFEGGSWEDYTDVDRRGHRRPAAARSGAAPTTPAASRTSRSSSARRVRTSSPRTASRTSPRRTSPRSGSRARTSARPRSRSSASRRSTPSRASTPRSPRAS